jgi:2-amino-4-hydroxy-6-hydroxymethyldihydropteridine diphosphokinase
VTSVTTAVLSLGSNLGDRRAHLRAAIELIGRRLPVLAFSSPYETEPVGGGRQPSYLNCAALVATADPEEALAAAHVAEDTRGRLRSTRWGPRTLDVDVISVDAITRNDARLTLPHPRAHERAFVLVPWLEIEPNAVLPGRGRVADLVRALDTDDVTQVSW